LLREKPEWYKRTGFGADQLTFMKCGSFADLGVAALTEAWNELVQRVKSTLQQIIRCHT